MKVAILGTGSWGTALGQVLCDNGQEVLMWGIRKEEVEDINQNHRNHLYFDTPISEKLTATQDLQEIHDADLVLLAVPTIAIEETVEKVAKIVDKKVIVINVAKGFHPVTHERLSVVIGNHMPKEHLKSVVSLIGPSHAEEVILRLVTVLNAVSDQEEDAKLVQTLFSNSYFRVYRSTDVVGAEIGVAVKNIMAIASGILEGIGQGDNARAALMTRGLAEMARFGIAQGGKPETYLGLDGVGDLIVTCTSKHSRNFTAGYAIGQAGQAKEFLATNTKTVEGILACKVVYEEAKKQNIAMPITDEMYRILYEDADPKEAVMRLMSRDLKAENEKQSS